MAKIHLQKLIEDASEHLFLNELDETFKSGAGGYRIGKNNSISIFQKDRTWLIHDFTEDSTRNALQFISDRYGLNLKDREQLFQATKIICDLDGLRLQDYTNEEQHQYKPRKVLRKKQKKAALKYVPNRGREPKKITDHLVTELEPMAMEYLQKKTGASIEIIQEYNVKQCIHAFGKRFKGEDIAIVWNAGGNRKYKRPQAAKEDKERWLQSCGNYVFGWDQLPEMFGTLIIAPGETDTIALNALLHDTGVKAICLNSETTRITPEMVQIFKQRGADDIVCLFDNDSTGAKAMQRNFQDHGIPYIDIGQVVNDPVKFPDCKFQNGRNITLNDVCDLIGYWGKEKTREILLNIPPHQWNRVEFDRYLHTETLQSVFDLTSRAIIKAPAGSGKTTAAMRLADIWPNTKHIPGRILHTPERVIIAVPTVAIAEQQQSDYFKASGSRPPIIGGGHQQDHLLRHKPLIIAVWDSLHQLECWLQDSTLIVDEAHLLSDAAGFRLKACNDVLRLSKLAKHTALMSATPVVFPGFDLVEFVNTGKRQRKQIQPIEYTGKIENFELPQEPGLHIVRANDTELLNALQSKVAAGQSTIISSKDNGKYLKENSHYERLMAGEKLVNKKDQPFYLFATSLIDVGVSITEQVQSIHNLTPGSPRESVQIIARARMTDSTNKMVKMYEYSRKGRKPKQAGINLIDLENRLREQAQSMKEWLNDGVARGLENDFTLKGDNAELIFKDGGRYYISEAFIKYRVAIAEQSATTEVQKLEIKKRIDPNIETLPIQQADYSKDANKVLKDAREKRRLQKVKARALYLRHTDTIHAIISHISKDHKLKKEMQRRYGPMDHMDHDLFYSENRELFDAGLFDMLIWRHLELTAIGVTEAEAIKVIVIHGNKRSWSQVFNQYVIAHKRLRKDQQDKVRALHKAVRQAKQNGRDHFTGPEINKLVKAAGFELYGKAGSRKHLERVRWVFDVERIEKGVYKVGKKHSKISLKRMTKTAIEFVMEEFSQLFDHQQVMIE